MVTHDFKQKSTTSSKSVVIFPLRQTAGMCLIFMIRDRGEGTRSEIGKKGLKKRINRSVRGES